MCISVFKPPKVDWHVQSWEVLRTSECRHLEGVANWGLETQHICQSTDVGEMKHGSINLLFVISQLENSRKNRKHTARISDRRVAIGSRWSASIKLAGGVPWGFGGGTYSCASGAEYLTCVNASITALHARLTTWGKHLVDKAHLALSKWLLIQIWLTESYALFHQTWSVVGEVHVPETWGEYRC